MEKFDAALERSPVWFAMPRCYRNDCRTVSYTELELTAFGWTLLVSVKRA